MKSRIIAGLLVGLAWILVLCFLPGWTLCALLCIMSCLCQAEFYGMFKNGKTRFSSSPAWGMALGCTWLVYTFVFPPSSSGVASWMWLFPLMIFLFLVRVLFMRRVKPVEYAAMTLLGFLYIPFMLSYLIRIAQWGVPHTEIGTLLSDRSGIFLAFFTACAVKFCDIGGFAVGIPFGRHKLMPSISPKKSWEGLLGGILFSVAVSIGLVALAQKVEWIRGGPLETLPLYHAAVIGVLMSVVGLLGDLIESRFKREADIKDSAGLLPGLGGILDMFDSLIFAPAALYFYLTLFAE